VRSGFLNIYLGQAFPPHLQKLVSDYATTHTATSQKGTYGESSSSNSSRGCVAAKPESTLSVAGDVRESAPEFGHCRDGPNGPDLILEGLNMAKKKLGKGKKLKATKTLTLRHGSA
jgi:hypothetical protein